MFLNLKKNLLNFSYKLNKKTGGRNNKGRITMRHRGGGHKRLFYNKNWNNITNKNILIGHLYQNYKEGNLDIFLNLDTKKIISYSSSVENKLFQFLYNDTLKNITFLKNIEPGSYVFNIEGFKNTGPVYSRSKLSYSQIIQVNNLVKKNILIRLPSKNEKMFHFFNRAFVVLNLENLKQQNIIKTRKGKAGFSRWLGKRPSVRGVAMNPVDHPHGGGEGKTSGGRPSTSFKGILTKGYKTKRKKNAKI